MHPTVRLLPITLGVRLLFKGMSRTKWDVLSAVNRRFLLTWGKVVDLVMEANHVQEEFGIGFLFHTTEAAERHMDDSGVYFLVNPNLVSLRSSYQRHYFECSWSLRTKSRTARSLITTSHSPLGCKRSRTRLYRCSFRSNVSSSLCCKGVIPYRRWKWSASCRWSCRPTSGQRALC